MYSTRFFFIVNLDKIKENLLIQTRPLIPYQVSGNFAQKQKQRIVFSRFQARDCHLFDADFIRQLLLRSNNNGNAMSWIFSEMSYLKNFLAIFIFSAKNSQWPGADWR